MGRTVSISSHLANRSPFLLEPKAGDLSFDQARKFELSFKLKAAKALGMGTPGSLLARADEVIE
jgi:hypothetical protein